MSKQVKAALLFWGAIALIGITGLALWLFYFRFRAYTDDAYVEGNLVVITPLRAGFVQSIHTDDTYLVERDQTLVVLDATDAEIALDQAEENLAQTVRDVCQIFHNVFTLRAELQGKKAEFIKARQDFHHRQDVIEAGGVSLENFEHAIAALRANYYALRSTFSELKKALAATQGRSIQEHPLVLAAADQLREAYVQLHRCTLYSPVRGLAAQRTIQVGMWVPAGKPLLSVIPLDQIWVNANFKETQLKHMRIGQAVKITSDLYGREVVYHGKIAGLPGAAGNAFSLLPPQNLSGNWIKIVQRLPVRVELDPKQLERYPLRVGLSMHATVDLREDGPLLPDSSSGSPLYETPIFEEEEEGDLVLIEEIIDANLDPSLIEFKEQPMLYNVLSQEDEE